MGTEAEIPLAALSQTSPGVKLKQMAPDCNIQAGWQLRAARARRLYGCPWLALTECYGIATKRQDPMPTISIQES